MSNSFTESTDRKSTMGLDHFGKKYTVGEKDLKLQLWDTGGEKRGQWIRRKGRRSRTFLFLFLFLFLYALNKAYIKLDNLYLMLGMERVASITSSYYKYSEAAILVFALDNPDTFHILSQHLLDIVTYAENAKIFL